MTWLFVLVLILQASFHWILNPLIVAFTKVFELSNLPLLILFLILWIFSGGERIQKIKE